MDKYDDPIIRMYLNVDLFSRKEEWSFNSFMYYPSGFTLENDYTQQARLLNETDDLDKLSGKFHFEYAVENISIGDFFTEFISYSFDNFNEFTMFFIKFFSAFYNYFTFEELIDIDEAVKLSYIMDLANKCYKKEKTKLKRIQKDFIQAVECIYNINNLSELEELNLKQRFLIAQVTIKNFSNYCIDIDYNKVLGFSYNEVIEYSDEESLIKTIKRLDPDGDKISSNNKFITSNIFNMFYISLYHLVFLNDTYIKKCKNCNKYFITTKSNTVYCNHIWNNDKSCKEIGNMISQRIKENSEYTYGKYRSIYSKKAMLVKRNPDIDSYKEDYDKWKNEAQKFIKDIKQGIRTNEEFEEWLEKTK